MSQALGGGGKASGGEAWLTLACSAGGRLDRLSLPGLGGAGGPLPWEHGAWAGLCCPNLLSRFRLDSWYDVDASALALEFLCGVGGGFLMLPGGDLFSGEPEVTGGGGGGGAEVTGGGGGGGAAGKPELSDGGGGKSGSC